MNASVPPSSAALREEILRQARTRADDILRRAREQAAALTREADERSRSEGETKRAEARAEADRCIERTLATVPVERERLIAAHTEALLESVRNDLQFQLASRDAVDIRASLIALAAGAIRHMEGTAFVVQVAATDRDLLDQTALNEIRTRAEKPGATLTVETSVHVTGGVLVRDAEGRQEWDNRPEARLARSWPELRRRLALASGLVGKGPP
jgi:V/A-type H+-transporting ATPase subunit E